ncbi:MAG: hypothetical protein WC314_19945 [Vulcanimicrobiota bacterium]
MAYTTKGEFSGGQIDIRQVADLDGSLVDLQDQIDGAAASSALTSHIEDDDNPHEVTATQVGAYTTGEVDGLLSAKASTSALSSHTGNTDNPHEVTATQVGAIPSAQKAAANGVASLDANGKIPVSQLPAPATGERVPVADEAARFALTTNDVQIGDIVVQTSPAGVYWVVDTANLDSEDGYLNHTPLVLNEVGPALDLVPTGTVNGTNRDFLLQSGSANVSLVELDSSKVDVYVKQLWQVPSTDYTIIDNGSGSAMIRFTEDHQPESGWPIHTRGTVH